MSDDPVNPNKYSLKRFREAKFGLETELEYWIGKLWNAGLSQEGIQADIQEIVGDIVAELGVDDGD